MATEIKNRIKKIIEHENISYGEFAELVGMQRSGVSHLISGRNNPSLEIIQKILTAFDYINTDWLLLGKGTMIKDEKKEVQKSLFDQPIENKIITENKILEPENKPISVKNMPDDTDTKKISASAEDNFKDEDEKKEVVKIVIFYSDKTFSDYIPE